jgi:hypothetical protein
MNNIYKNKYEKYKNKYILLKQEIQEGGLLKFIGSGTSGCLICPPPAMSAMSAMSAIPKNDNSFKISDFSFDNQNDCEYVGKILAIKEQGSKGDSYEDELEQFLKIKKLDPNGDYTPQLMYANIHTKDELLKNIKNIKPEDITPIPYTDKDQNSESEKAYKCINEKITNDRYGYIISKYTGKSLLDKYNGIIETNMQKLKEFLIKFKELFSFIKILYDNSFLHLDIKIDNITVKENENNKLYLIDFGRTVELKDNDKKKYNKIINLLKENHYMYSFEPKIYYNLLFNKKFNKELNEELSFKELINYIEENFKSLIDPYDYNSKDEDTYMDILKKILDKININTEDQKEYFINYLEECYSKFCYNKFKLLAKNVEENMWEEYQEKIEKIYENYKIDKSYLFNFIFYPIIDRYDIYSMGIVLAEIVLFSHNFDDCDEIFKEQFIELIKNLLFNKFYDVSVIISEIDELQELI